MEDIKYEDDNRFAHVYSYFTGHNVLAKVVSHDGKMFIRFKYEDLIFHWPDHSPTVSDWIIRSGSEQVITEGTLDVLLELTCPYFEDNYEYFNYEV